MLLVLENMFERFSRASAWPCALLGMLSLTAPVEASSAQGRVTVLIARGTDGLLYVEIEGAPSNRPACASDTRYYMVRDENSSGGKSQFAMLMSAYISGVPVSINGTGLCSRWVDGEDIDTVMFARSL
jgi:hypothetical protein